MLKNNYTSKGLKSYIWLFMALTCIVFSSASKRLIEQKVNPANYNAELSFNKKIKDGSRDKHEYLSKVVHGEKRQSSDDNFAVLVLLSALISLVLLYVSEHVRQVKYKEQSLAFAGLLPVYLQHHRLQV